MMLSLKKFSPNDIYFIETDYAFPKESREMFANYKNAVGYTAFHDGTIVALGGVHIMWEGVAEGWFIMSKNAYQLPISMARATANLIDSFYNDNKLVRIQASVNVNDNKSISFAIWLGFKEEGVMKQYGPNGDDYIRLARFA